MLRLEAVAVYRYDQEVGSFVAIPGEVVKQKGTVFFPNYALDYFEQAALNTLIQYPPASTIHRGKCDNNKYYAKWFENPNELGGGHLCVIVVERGLHEEDGDHGYLLHNLHHIHERGEQLNRSVQDMLSAPNAFLGVDIHTRKIRQDVEELKKVARRNLDLMRERGDAVELLEEGTERLLESSGAFKLNATKLEDSYTCCGPVRRKVFGNN